MRRSFKYLCGTILAVMAFFQTTVTEAHILSNSEEWSIGRQASLKYESINDCVEDSDLEEIYQDILNSNNLPKKSRSRSFQDLKLSNEATINAFELPGGFIYVTRQMKNFLLDGYDRSALAFVIAHEMSHHINEDYLRKYDKKFTTGFLFDLLAPKLQGYEALYASAAEDLITTLNSRQMNFRTEQQADEKGLDLLIKSDKYSPGGAAVFFSRLIELEKTLKFTNNFTYPHSKSDVRLKRSLDQIKTISNGRVEIKDNKFYLDGQLVGKTGLIPLVEGEKMTELEKTYLVAGNIAKAIARGEWKKENIYLYYAKNFENCRMEAGDIFIGKLKTENNDNNIALELYYSLSRYYKVTELPFIKIIKMIMPSDFNERKKETFIVSSDR